jgi:glycosyltransferase involved in cell wall biosynthesis
MKKIIVFQPALAPYRIDFFNELAKSFNSIFIFNTKNLLNQKLNQDRLIGKCDFIPEYLDRGWEFCGRSIRFGIIRKIKKERPDIVFTSEFGYITIVIFLYRILTAFKFKLVVISDNNIDIIKKKNCIQRLIQEVIIYKSDCIICPSEDVCLWYKKRFKKKLFLDLPIIQDDNIFRANLSNNISLSNKLISQYQLYEKKVVLYVGRFVKVKNLFLLLNVLSLVKENDIVLVMIGKGELFNAISEELIKRNLQKKVLLVGQKEGNELYAWYNIGQLFILPSISELFGAVVNEALLSGCRVLCSKLAGASS